MPKTRACISCFDLISQKRLLVLPNTRICTDCMNKSDVAVISQPPHPKFYHKFNRDQYEVSSYLGSFRTTA